jgi:primosomal protein N' (replication factor Y)
VQELDFNDSERSTFFVDVVLPLYLPKAYTYRVPYVLNDRLEIGKRVVVQFGSRKVYAGLIINIHTIPPKEYSAKYIQDIIDDEPVISALQLKHWQWMEEYYLCNLGEIMAAALPGGLKLESETKIYVNPEAIFEYGDLDDKEYLIVEALEIHKEITINQISELLGIKSVIPIIKSMYDKGVVLIKEQLNDTYKTKKQTCIRLTFEYSDNEPAMHELFNKLEKTPKQLEVLMTFMASFKDTEHISRKALLAKSKSSASTINTLINKKVFEIYEIEIDRISYDRATVEEINLTPPQQIALDQIHTHFEKKDVVLLHGVTSSGKTLVYSKLIEEAIAKGQQVLYLLPEVALTTQIIQRITQFFGNSVCVWHYKFSDFERVEIWNKIRTEKFKIIIGTRSSVFLPFQNLGLVIVDEEHDQSYKQNDPSPRYHGRDAAIVLASLHHAKTLLGTATPAIETYYNTHQQKYGLVELKERYAGMQMPEIILADVGQSNRDKTLSFDFTPTLLEKLRSAILKKEQVILFQNRKGYVPITECSNCGWTPHCINCDITLTYYKIQDILKCHYCGYKTRPATLCGACGATQMRTKGFGTEKIEDDLKNLLPDIRISRLDYDTTRTKEGHSKIINEFRQKNIDVLVGTQMVSKGLDFENVTTVGIMDADQIINIPDFRANERAFQMLTQVAGRAGRMHKTGEVIIQTRRPTLDIFQVVIENNYQALYLYEMAERQKFLYPPFSKLIRITIKHKEEHEVKRGALQFATILREQLGDTVLGPEANFIPRIQNLYIQNIMLKIPHQTVSLKIAKQFLKTSLHNFVIQKENKSLRVYIDVDAY